MHYKKKPHQKLSAYKTATKQTVHMHYRFEFITNDRALDIYSRKKKKKTEWNVDPTALYAARVYIYRDTNSQNGTLTNSAPTS